MDDNRQRFSSVWDALKDTPEESENMKVRSALMRSLQKRVKEWNVTQAEAARKLGINQPRLNDLLKGRIQKFSLDALVNMAPSAQMHVHITIEEDRPAMV